jgi:RNA polymerase-binding transcription factor DksA
MATSKQSDTKKASKPVVKKPTSSAADMLPQEKSHIPIKKRVIPEAPRKSSDTYKEVKIPNITTTASIPYNPDYVPMEKRVEEPKPMAPLVKYSDFELNDFRNIINKKMDVAKKELAYLQGLISRKDGVGENEDARYMSMEDGSMSMEREQLSQMASRQISYIDHLEKAIMRIENKTYGICRITGKLIDKARLKAVPHATLSLEAKLGLVKSGGE